MSHHLHTQERHSGGEWHCGGGGSNLNPSSLTHAAASARLKVVQVASAAPGKVSERCSDAQLASAASAASITPPSADAALAFCSRVYLVIGIVVIF